jgi:DNA-binding transcriptional LysR family regulator
MPQRYLNDAQPCEVLFEDEFVGITWKDNPLIPENARLSLEAYMSLGHVTSRFASARAATVDDWFVSQLGYKRNVEVVTMNFTSVVCSIPGTRRVATIHRRLADYFARYLPIRLFEAPFEVPRLAEAVQWHRHFNNDPGLLWLREVLSDAARHGMPASHAPRLRGACP